MTELEKAARMALEQLEFLNACYPHKTAADAITALTQALATTERKGEPVAWMLWTHGPVLVFLNKDEAKLEFERLNHTYPEPARKLIHLYTSPQVPEDHPLMVFAIECEMGALQEHEVPLRARTAIRAARKGEKS